ncbi:10948_t:CDS:2 [Acaulospora colombiana]|uniref:10948_t:CDS:1 n=1 Tax=Acaulospora colombiana TaxID=27376 RepID=A0ACA9JX86_9GLOM|nr:10948_t:CDS:2 [Acaulospora colombiana]
MTTTTERPIDDHHQITGDWLLSEQRKIENVCNENIREFTTTCLLEVDWLKNYLTGIIINPHCKPPVCTSSNHRSDAQHKILEDCEHDADQENASKISFNYQHQNEVVCFDVQEKKEQDKEEIKDLNNVITSEHESKKFERKKTLIGPNSIRIEPKMEPRILSSFRSSNASSRDCVKGLNDLSNKKTTHKRLAQSKPEIKSLVLAAAAAKKEQEEQEKKYERIKEWEAKRLAASQRRHEEEQKRLQNARLREEEWKRKANFIPETKKKENDSSKKKRVDKTAQKKKEIDARQRDDVPSEKTSSQLEHKNILQKSPSQSSDFLCDQRNDQSEFDWNSRTDDEFPHSEEEETKRPEWCRQSNLNVALIHQASIDPEIIFGKIQPLNMEKIFRGRERKFRQRSSSANWFGGDALTIQEEIEYKFRMGFK